MIHNASNAVALGKIRTLNRIPVTSRKGEYDSTPIRQTPVPVRADWEAGEPGHEGVDEAPERDYYDQDDAEDADFAVGEDAQVLEEEGELDEGGGHVVGGV